MSSTSTHSGRQDAAAASAAAAAASSLAPECGHTHHEEEVPWPVVTAAQIAKSLEAREHFLDPNKGRTQACLSDMAGMLNTGYAVHRVELGPGKESTVLHSHLAESEWVYILDGEATLLLARSHGDLEDLRPVSEGHVEYSEVQLKAGDFAGFAAGNPRERYAHALRAGDKGVKYILGGDRKDLDVITYPTLGKTLVSHEATDGEAMFSARAGE